MPAPALVDPIKAFKLRYTNHLTFQEIADYFGVKNSSIQQALQRLSALVHTPAETEEYNAVKPALLGTVEHHLLASLTDPEKLAKASLHNVAFAFEKVATQLRLEKGQSTSNVSFLSKVILASDQIPSKPLAEKQE